MIDFWRAPDALFRIADAMHEFCRETRLGRETLLECWNELCFQQCQREIEIRGRFSLAQPQARLDDDVIWHFREFDLLENTMVGEDGTRVFGVCIRRVLADRVLSPLANEVVVHQRENTPCGSNSASTEAKSAGQSKDDRRIPAASETEDASIGVTAATARGYVNLHRGTLRNSAAEWFSTLQLVAAAVGKKGRLPTSKALLLSLIREKMGIKLSNGEIGKFIARNLLMLHHYINHGTIPGVINMNDRKSPELPIEYVIVEALMLWVRRSNGRFPSDPQALAQVILDVADTAGPDVRQLAGLSDVDSAIEYGSKILKVFWNDIIQSSPETNAA
jgi:hypothetical protein